MLREWFKEMLREIFDEKTNEMTYSHIDRTISARIDTEIKGAMSDIVTEIHTFNLHLNSELEKIRVIVDDEMGGLQTLTRDSLREAVESLPKRLENMELNLDGVEDALNSKVRQAVSSEISRNQNNMVVHVAQKQFREFAQEFDYISGLRKKD